MTWHLALHRPRRRGEFAGGEDRIAVGLLLDELLETFPPIIHMSLRELREGQCFLLVLYRLVEVPGFGVRGGESVNPDGILPRCQLACPGRVLKSELPIPYTVRTGGQNPRKVIVGVGVLDVEPECFAVAVDRTFHISLTTQSVTQVDVGDDELGVEPDRLAVASDRTLHIALVAQG